MKKSLTFLCLLRSLHFCSLDLFKSSCRSKALGRAKHRCSLQAKDSRSRIEFERGQNILIGKLPSFVLKLLLAMPNTEHLNGCQHLWIPLLLHFTAGRATISLAHSLYISFHPQKIPSTNIITTIDSKTSLVNLSSFICF